MKNPEQDQSPLSVVLYPLNNQRQLYPQNLIPMILEILEDFDPIRTNVSDVLNNLGSFGIEDQRPNEGHDLFPFHCDVEKRYESFKK